MRVLWKQNVWWGFSECDLFGKWSQAHSRERSRKKQRKKAERGWVCNWILDCEGGGISETQITPWLYSWGKGTTLCYPVPVKLGRAVYPASHNYEALTANSQSRWDMGSPAGQRAPTLFTMCVHCRAHTVYKVVLNTSWISLNSHFLSPRVIKSEVIANDSV